MKRCPECLPLDDQCDDCQEIEINQADDIECYETTDYEDYEEAHIA